VLLTTVGGVFAFGLLEVGVRLVHLVPDRFWEPDAQLGARLTPDAHGWWTQEEREFVVPIRINRQGLRDVEHGYEKPSGVYRVLLLGDSFVEAMHVPLEATIGRQLEQRVNDAGGGRRIEVVAAGVSGYGTAGELLYFRRDGKRYHPDLVVLAFYPGNDVKNNSASLEDALRPVYATDGDIERVVGLQKSEHAHGWRALLVRSKAYQFLRQLLLVRQPQLAHGLARLGLLRKDAIRQTPLRNGVPVDFGVYAATVDAPWQDAWQHTFRLLQDLRREAENVGAGFAIVIVSAREQVYPEAWKQVVAANAAMQGATWDIDGPQHRVEEWCSTNRVACLALAPELRAAAQAGSEPLHFMRDGHWTPAGHRLAGTLVAEFLRKSVMQTTQSNG
jgi:hypothetical protein